MKIKEFLNSVVVLVSIAVISVSASLLVLCVAAYLKDGVVGVEHEVSN